MATQPGPVSEARHQARRWALGAVPALGIVVSGTAGLVLSAWFFDIESLKSLAPGLATMKANTALCFLLEGLALTFLVSTSENAIRRRVARGCALMALVVGGLSLASYLSAWSPGIDELFVRDLQTPQREHPGRMTLMTAIAHVCLASSILFLRSKKGDRPSLSFGIACLVISGVAASGYLYGVPSLYATFAFRSFALHTALLFLACGFAVCLECLERNGGAILFFPTAEGRLSRTLLPAALITPIVLGWGWIRGYQAGLFDAAFGIAMLAISTSLLVGLLVFRSIRALARSQRGLDQTRRALDDRHEQLQLLLAFVPAAVVFLDEALRVVAATPRWRSDFGLRDVEPRGKQLRRLIPGAPEQWEAAHRRALGGEAPSCAGELFEGNDGKPEWIRWSMHPWPMEAEGRRGVIAFSELITERKAAEEADRQRVYQQCADQRMESLGRLAGGIAHDFNNLLTVILGFTGLVDESNGTLASASDDLKNVARAAERAQGLTRQLLAFSRRQVLEPVRFELNHVLGEMSSLLQRVIGEDIDLTTDFDPAACPVIFDKSQMEQVLMNLVLNARDAMPAGGEIVVRTRRIQVHEGHELRQEGAQVGAHVVLSVSDRGIGMSQATIDQIFDPFFTTKEQGKGTGLGLATVYGVTTQGGGIIQVGSKIGEGTTIRITLPLTHEGTVRTKTAVLPSGRRTPGSATVLVVEDEPLVRSYISRVLQNAGYPVLEAEDVAHAIEIWNQKAPDIDLLLTDVVMPKISGREIARRFHEERPELPVLFLSGYPDQVMSRAQLREARAAFLEKPVSAEKLRSTIRELLCLAGTQADQT